jgi:hypothetical protein
MKFGVEYDIDTISFMANSDIRLSLESRDPSLENLHSLYLS